MENKESIDDVVKNDKTEPSKGIQYLAGGTVITAVGLCTLMNPELGPLYTAGVLLLGELGKHYFEKAYHE